MDNSYLLKIYRLYEQRFALFIHTNEALRELWPPHPAFQITTGAVKFFENPQLCYNDIETFLNAANTNHTDSEVSFNFNGYKRFTCSNQTITLVIERHSSSLTARWNVTIADLRRLKGFIVSYAEVPDGFLIDQNDPDSNVDTAG